MTLRAKRRWNYINRNHKDFKNPSTIKSLYIALVRSILTYRSIIRKKRYQNSIHRIEKIRHKILRKIAILSGNCMSKNDHDYSPIANKFCIPSKKSPMDYNDSKFIFKIISNDSCKFLKQNYSAISEQTYSLRLNSTLRN